MTEPHASTRVVAIRPTSRGFGFAVLEGEAKLLDWGSKDVRKASNERCLRLAEQILAAYRPDALVLEDLRDPEFRRCARVSSLLKQLKSLGRKLRIEVHSFARRQIRGVLWSSRAITKHQIACAVAERLPELRHRLPPPRKPWMSQDDRMSMFDAAALALVFYRVQRALGSEQDP